MARVTREQAAQSKERIIHQAARLFRVQGYHATGLDQVMKEAGLTVGTFYAHFDSKQDLLIHVMKHLLPKITSELIGPISEDITFENWIKVFSDSYMAPTHRDFPEQGCPLPSLAPELARAGTEVGEMLNEILLHALKQRATGFTKKKRQTQTEELMLAHLALGVGAISLSRALGDSPLSGRVLKAAKKLANSV